MHDQVRSLLLLLGAPDRVTVVTPLLLLLCATAASVTVAR
jgi:hypothetical protein